MLTKILKLIDLPSHAVPYPVLLFLLNFTQGLLVPILIVFYRNKNINLFEIGLIASVFEVSMFLFEIPTGYVADKWGRKLSVEISFICFSIAGVIFALCSNLYGFIIGSVIQGLGFTFTSGALQAWCVDTLKRHNNEDQVQHVFVAGTRFKTLGFFLGSILGGYLGLMHMYSVWAIFISTNILAWIFAKVGMNDFMADIKIEKVDEKKEFRHIIGTLLVDNSRSVMKLAITLFIITIIYEFSLSPINEYWTVLFTEQFKIETVYLGWIAGISSILLVLFIKPVVSKLSQTLAKAQILFVLNLFLVLVIFLMAIAVSPTFAVGAYILYRLIKGVCEPVQDTYINSIINDKYRATILSTYNMAGSIGEVISGVGIGVIAESFGLRTAFYISSVGILAVALLLLYINASNEYELETVKN